MRGALRRKWLPVAALAGVLLAAGITVYGFLIEPRRLTVTRVPITRGDLASLLAGRRAVFLSDLHFYGHDDRTARKILAALQGLKPDLVLLAGDYVRWQSRAGAYDEAFDFLSRLSAPLGVFAVTGDADGTYSRKSCEFCHEPGSGRPTRRPGAVFLKNAATTVVAPRGPVTIAGVDGELDEARDFVAATLTATGTPMILLSHSALSYRAIDPAREVLVLAGDTHGGQIRLPRWFWRIVRRKPDPEHFSGLFHDGKKSLFVSRGVGTSWPHVRLGEPPEIVVLDFRPEEGGERH